MNDYSKKFDYEPALEALLKTLDSTVFGDTESAFKNKSDVDYYETLVMFSVRKEHAARHHFNNVQNFIEKSKAATNEQMELPNKEALTGLKVTEMTMFVAYSSTKYVHELSAFCSAIRSGLDFLAQVAARNLAGVSAHSMHTLMKMVDKGQTGGILDVVSTHRKWLGELKNYRDEIVHRLVVQAPVEGYIISTKGITSKENLPVVIPRKTPKLIYDTRNSRAFGNDILAGLDRFESTAEVAYSDGSEVTEHTVKYKPSADYILLSEFMAETLASYVKLLSDMFAEMEKMNFNK